MSHKLFDLFQMSKQQQINIPAAKPVTVIRSMNDGNASKAAPQSTSILTVAFDSIWSYEGRPNYLFDDDREGLSALQIFDAEGHELHKTFVDRPLNQVDVTQCIKGTAIPPGLYQIRVTHAGMQRRVPIQVV